MRMSDVVENLVSPVRDRVVQSATAPFTHAPYPLANTLDYQGDPGLLGPGSVSWAVLADVATFVGGIRALLIQAVHPEVVAGVGDHSRYQDDPLGRLSRTSAYVTATTYGAMPEVEAALERVKRMHRVVAGVSSRGVDYEARDPRLSAWVHNALTDSFITAHVVYGGTSLSIADEDRFVEEQTRVGALLGADPMPASRAELASWIETDPDIEPTTHMRAAVDFLANPPLGASIRLPYKVLFEAALVTIPPRIRDILGLRTKPGSRKVGKSLVSALRWTMGYSPSWHLALERVGAPIPDGMFRHETRLGGRRRS